MTNQSTTLLIDKKELHKVNFSRDEVLKSKEQIMERRNRLTASYSRSIPGNSNIVTITIRSIKRGLLKVKTRVLMTGREYAVLKGGQMIPLRAITNVSL